MPVDLLKNDLDRPTLDFERGSGLFRDFALPTEHFVSRPFQFAIRAKWSDAAEAVDFVGVNWSEREDLNLRPLVSQTSALTGLRHAPMPFP